MQILAIRLKIVAVFLLTITFITLSAQESKIKSINQSTLIGIGQSFLNDTYLSPLEYKGLTVSLLNDRIAPAGFIHEKMLLQQQFLMQVAFTKNPSASASEYYGMISYNANSLYPFLEKGKLKLFGGGGIDAALGGIYNVRNSNNPGSLKTSLNINLSTMATYNWRCFTFRWQFSTPVLGMFFSPEYGQSYYEIFSLGNGKGTIQFGTPFNQLALRSYFTVDIPINNMTVRTGYLANYYKTDINDIFTKIISHQFMIGLVVESVNFGGKKIKENNLIKSSYY